MICNMPSRFARVLAALLTLSQASAIAAADWVEYTSANFTVYSDAPENRVVGVIEEVEELRQILHATLDVSSATKIEKIRVVIFDRFPEYGRLVSDSPRGVFALNVLEGAMFVLPMETSEETRSAIAWAYTTLLMRRYSAVEYPRWYSTGLRELLSNAEFSVSEIVLGVPPNGEWNPAPVSQVIRGEYDEQGSFLTSWLLVHHLVIESIGNANRQRAAEDYLRRFDAGEDPESAFLASFGKSPRDFQSELEFDARTARLATLNIPRVRYNDEMTLRTLAQDEAAYVRGGIALTLQSYAPAIEYFDSIADSDDDSQFADRIDSKRAIALIHDGRVEEGDAQLEELLTQDIDDGQVLADICHYAFDRHAVESEGAGARRDYRGLAIEYGERAVTLDGGNLGLLLDLGRAYEANGDFDRASETLLRAYDIDTSSSMLGLTLARVLIKSGRFEMAHQMLSRVYRASGSDEERDQILEVQGRMTEPDFDLSMFDVLNDSRK